MSDTTFRAYTADQARAYGSARTSYPRAIYDTVLDYHFSTGGEKNVFLDIGCGPGNATRDLALHFDRALGTDPGEQMINTANELGGKSLSGENITFAVASAEDSLNGIVQPGLVSLITAAMAVSTNICYTVID